MAEREKGRTRRGVAPRSRLQRSEKIEKKLRGIERGVGAESDGVHTVVIRAKRTPVEICGFLVSQNEHLIVFRHKRSSGSRKMRRSVFQTKDVIEVFGSVGEYSSITVMASKVISTFRGLIAKSKTSGIIKIKNPTTDEVTTIYPNDAIEVDIYEDEDDDGASGGRGRSRSNESRRSRRRETDNYDDSDDYDDDL